jgi:hypothetical protein
MLGIWGWATDFANTAFIVNAHRVNRGAMPELAAPGTEASDSAAAAAFKKSSANAGKTSAYA